MYIPNFTGILTAGLALTGGLLKRESSPPPNACAAARVGVGCFSGLPQRLPDCLILACDPAAANDRQGRRIRLGPRLQRRKVHRRRRTRPLLQAVPREEVDLLQDRMVH